MTIPLSQLAAIWAIIGLGSVVQGTIGFASGMLALPVLLFAGWTLPEAIAINLVAGVAQNLYGTYMLRRAVLWLDWLRPNLVRLAALPVGVWALTYATGSTRRSCGSSSARSSWRSWPPIGCGGSSRGSTCTSAGKS